MNMATKQEVLEKHNFTPDRWALLATAYFRLPSDVQRRFNEATNDLAENAIDLTFSEITFIASLDSKLENRGIKTILTDKAKKNLQMKLKAVV
jgi:hypothetical protein